MAENTLPARGSRQSLRELVDDHLTYRRSLGLLATSQQSAYRARFDQFLEMAGERGPEAVTRRLITDWKAALGDVNAETRKRHVAALRAFCAWLVQTGRLEVNPMTRPPSRAEALRATRPAPASELRSASTLLAALAYVQRRVKRGEFRSETASNQRHLLAYFADTIGNPDASAITRRHVERWMELPGAPAARRSRFSAARCFCRWLVAERVLARDPFEGFSAPKEPRRLPRALPRTDVVKALDAAADDRRLTLMLLLMVQEGLRCVEVANLQTGDIDTGERSILVSGKGGHQRLLPLSDETWAAMVAYWAENPAGAGALIRSLTHPHSGLGANTIWVWLPQRDCTHALFAGQVADRAIPLT